MTITKNSKSEYRNSKQFQNPKFEFQRFEFCSFYSGCQKNVPIAGRFFATTLMPPSFFSEHYYDKRYNFGFVSDFGFRASDLKFE